MVLVHGLISSIDSWPDTFIEALSADRPVYLVALPGHFPSTVVHHDDRVTGRFLADCLAVQIHALVGENPVFLFGHSTGGLASIATAFYYPNLVKGLMVCGGLSHGRETVGDFAIMQKLVIRYGVAGDYLNRFLLGIYGVFKPLCRSFVNKLVFDHRIPEVKLSLDRSLDKYWYNRQRMDYGWMTRMMIDLAELDMTDKLGDIHMPGLFLTGDSDIYTTVTEVKAMAERMSDAQVRVFERCAHMLFNEKPEELVEAITSFVESVERPSVTD